MIRAKLPLALLILLAPAALGAGAVQTQQTTLKSFDIPYHGSLLLDIPAGWTSTQAAPPRPGMRPAIELAPPGKRLMVMITVIPSSGDNPEFNSQARLRLIAERAGARMLDTAVEKSLALKELKGPNTIGYYWTLTDASSAPGAYERVTTTLVGVADLILSVSILHHAKAPAELETALDMLRNAAHKPPVILPELRLRAPTGGWELVLPIGGMQVLERRQDDAHGTTRIVAGNAKTGLTLSIIMEPAGKPGADSAGVRDAWWPKAQQSPLKKEQIQFGKAGPDGQYATVEYVVPDYQGQPINQKNLNIYIAHEGVWIDVHASKVQFSRRDQAMFDAVGKRLTFEKADGAPIAPH